MSVANPFLMPKLGLTMTEGVISAWHVKAGDEVQAGDILLIVETDKIATDIEAPEAGRIVSIEVAEGETVPVGTVIAMWTGPGSSAVTDNSGSIGEIQIQAPRVDADAPHEPPTQGAKKDLDRVLATPLARRLANREGLDISTLRGSGPNGRIKAADIREAYRLQKNASISVSLPEQTVRVEHVTPNRRPATQIEKVIARRLTDAKQSIPHFYVLSEADIGPIEGLRRALNDGADIRISINHFIIAALARALTAVPEAHRLWREGDIETPATIDIGVAVNTERGLFVPVLRNAATMTVDDIAHASLPLIERARSGRSQPSDLEGGAISVSNVGMFGATSLVPIINPGQSAILGVGAPKPIFRPDDSGQPSLRQEISLVLSCDHRVLDGVLAARLLDHVRDHLHQPIRLLRKKPDTIYGF